MVGDAMMELAILMQGFTPLEMAFFEGDINMAKRLIENGARDAMMEPPFMLQGLTPLDKAFFEGNINMAKRLIENGANTMVGDAMMELAILMQGFSF